MRKRTIALIIVLILALLASITIIQVYLEYTAAKGISVSIIKVSTENVKINSTTVTVALGFSNPSKTSLPPFQANFSAYLAGKNIGNGTIPQTHIVGNNVVTQTVSFNVTYAKVAESVVRSLISGQYNISVTGKARVNLVASLIPVTVQFSISKVCQGLTNTQNCTESYHVS